jgi:V8-like Glu-specific endopeptidase
MHFVRALAALGAVIVAAGATGTIVHLKTMINRTYTDYGGPGTARPDGAPPTLAQMEAHAIPAQLLVLSGTPDPAYVPGTLEASEYTNASRPSHEGMRQASSGLRGRRLSSIEVITSTYTFPATATVKILFYKAPYSYTCSGALVSAYHVLSAGHCVYDHYTSGNGWYDISTYYIISGQTDTYKPSCSSGWDSTCTDKPFGIARVTSEYHGAIE